MISHTQVDAVLGFDNLDVQLAVRSKVLDRPYTHDRMLIL